MSENRVATKRTVPSWIPLLEVVVAIVVIPPVDLFIAMYDALTKVSTPGSLSELGELKGPRRRNGHWDIAVQSDETYCLMPMFDRTCGDKIEVEVHRRIARNATSRDAIELVNGAGLASCEWN